MRRKTLVRTHWATLHLTGYAVFPGRLQCTHGTVSVFSGYSAPQKVFRLQETSAACSKPEESPVPTSAQRETTPSRNSPIERYLSRPEGCRWGTQGALQCQGTPGTGRRPGNDTGRYGSKERGGILDRAQNLERNSKIPLEEFFFFRSLRHLHISRHTYQKTPCNHLPMLSVASDSRAPQHRQAETTTSKPSQLSLTARQAGTRV